MMVRNESNFIEDLHVQGKSLLDSADGVSDMSPQKKKSKRLPARSKSLVDTNSNGRVTDVHRNMGRYTQSYLRRVPTQDDIYKILTETSDVIRPSTSTGVSKRLSPYAPLPAIGAKFRPLNNSDNKVTEVPESISVTSCDDSAQKLVREGTYNVLEPKFVKGPILNDLSRNAVDNFKDMKNKKRESPKKPENQLKESSATIVFGPRLPKDESDIMEEDLLATDLPLQTLQGDSPAVDDSDINNQNKNSLSVTQVNSIPVQKLYYRDSQQNGSRRLAEDLTGVNIGDSTNKGTNDKPRVHQSLWFD
jgi:hypothetical protein